MSLLWWIGCGGDHATAPTVPSAPAPPPNYVPAGTTLSVAFIHDGAPATGATLTLAGRTYTTDGRGEVRLADNAPWQSLLDVGGPNILDRQSLVRASMGTTLAVWPRMTASGIDPNYTAVLVYGDSAGSTPLRRLRPGTTEVVVVPEPSLQRNLQSRQAHEEAVGRMTLATDGRVQYRLAAERPASGVVVETKYFPEEPTCHPERGTLYAFASLSFLATGEIVGATIVYCIERGIVDYPNLILHELGHTFGLHHSPDGHEVMNAPARSSGYMSPREREAMLLLLARPAGNRYPDNDRGVATAGRAQAVILCR